MIIMTVICVDKCQGKFGLDLCTTGFTMAVLIVIVLKYELRNKLILANP